MGNRTRAILSALALSGCGGRHVGEPGAPPSAGGASNTGQAPVLTVGSSNEPRVTVIATPSTVCSGQCAEVRASIGAGTGHYEFTWNQGLPGSSGPFIVCPTSSTEYTVTVRQISGVEIRASTTTTASATVSVRGACSGETSSPPGSHPPDPSGSSAPPVSGSAPIPASTVPDAGVPGGQQPPPPGGDAPHEARIACQARIALRDAGAAGLGQLVREANTFLASAVACDSAGNIVVAGSFRGALDTGTQMLDMRGAEWAAFVVKFDAACRPLWAHTYGAPRSRVSGGPIAIDSRGEILVGGDVIPLPSNVDFGAGPTIGVEANPNAFLLKLRSDGTTVFSKVYQANEYAYVYGLAVDGQDGILLTGEASTGVSFGGPPIRSGSIGSYLVKIAADGTHAWTVVGPGFSSFNEVRGTAGGLVYVRGWARSGLDWGSGDTLGGASDVTFISQLDARGVHQWSRAIQSGAPGAWGAAIDVDGEGSMAAYGLEGKSPTSIVRALRGIDRDGVWKAPAEWSAEAQASQSGWLRTDGAGHTFETGFLLATMRVGATQMTPNGGSDVYIVKRNAAAQVLWSAQMGSSASDTPLGLATDAEGDAVVMWYTERDSPQDVFVTKFAP